MDEDRRHRIDVVAGRFRLEEVIGRGASGVVYRASDTAAGRAVAVKMLPAELVADRPEMLARFRREAEVLSRLDHPNIVRLQDMVEERGNFYLVMAYLPGGSLFDLLQQEERLPLQQALAIALELADALSRAHHLNVIHRDLKPANVLLAADGSPRLTDFGIAYLAGAPAITQTGTLLGTYAYLSPEACLDRSLDERADIWAFGVLLFQMVAGQLPFPGESPAAILNAILNRPLPDLHALRPDLPEALVDLIYRMLVKNRAERIPSIRLAGAELEQILQAPAASPAGGARFQTSVPAGGPPHNLPRTRTPLVGRAAELKALAQLLSARDVPLATLLGPGGVGKSRLALAAARERLPAFTHGVYFVSLAPLVAPEEIYPALAQAVGYHFRKQGGPRTQMLAYLAQKSLLLVLDNCEHLLPDVAEVVGDIVEAAPAVRLLATSRERLNLSTETLFQVGGLPYPGADSATGAGDYDAVRLFLQSARRLQAGYTLDETGLAQVARICRLVEGLPLALMLAAGWSNLLAPGEIADEIAENVDILATDMRDVPRRQQSLRSVFNYSWIRLDPEERAALAQMGVFRGGSTRAAAQAVTGASLRLLATLAGKSLLQRDATSGRYALHEVLRHFAEEHLVASGRAEAVRATHSTYYLAFLAQQRPALKGDGQLDALATIAQEWGNVYAAWRRACGHRQDAALAEAVESVYLFARMRSRWEAALELFAQALAAFPAEAFPALWQRLVLHTCALQPVHAQDPRREAALAQVLAGGTEAEIAFGLGLARDVALANRDLPGALALAEEQLARYQALGDTFYHARALQEVGYLHSIMNEAEALQERAEAGLALARAAGDRMGTAAALDNLAVHALYFAGDYAQAEDYYGEAAALFAEIGNRARLAFVQAGGLGVIMLLQGRLEAAAAQAQAAQALAEELNYGLGRAAALILLGQVAAGRGAYAEAEPLLVEAMGLTRHVAVQGWYHAGLTIAALGQGDYDAARHHFVQAVSPNLRTFYHAPLVWSLPLAACIVAGEGREAAAREVVAKEAVAKEAVALLALADGDAAAVPGWWERWHFLAALREELTATLSPAGYAEAAASGRARSLMEVAAGLIERFSRRGAGSA